MSWRTSLDHALDDAPQGKVRVHKGKAWADVDVEKADAIGVRIGGVRVHRARDRDIAAEAERLAHDLRSVPDPVVPVEVDPALGGAVLRSRPDRMRDREFYEVQVDGTRETAVRKVRVGADGDRQDAPWDVTREQLGHLLDELEG